MAIEQGIVIKLGSHGGKTAWVKTTRSSACESCSSRDSCNAGADGKDQEVEAINTADARVGDRIQLSIKTSSIIKAMFLLYLFPILCMLVGGMVGNWMAEQLDVNPSVIAAVTALICFGASLVVVRASGQKLGEKEAYRPKIIRVLGRSATLEDSQIDCASKHNAS